MKNIWLKKGNSYFPGEISDQREVLPPHVFKVLVHPPTGQLYAKEIEDKFQFSFKVYGLEDKFVKRVVKTFVNVKQNLGVLLNGLKGTGKSVTAQKMCNELNLPVLIITEHYDSLPSFLNEIQQEVVVFFDEFEKMYSNRDDSDGNILSLMDGVLSTSFKKVFILTTNNIYLNANMLQRPGRLRYLRTFSDLDKDTILEIIDDKLIYPEFKEDLINYISTLELITVDIVKSLTEEVNIHKEAPIEFKDYFNVKLIDKCADISMRVKGKWVSKYLSEEYEPLDPQVDDDFLVRKRYLGTIVRVEGNIITVYNHDKEVEYKIDKIEQKHRSFSDKSKKFESEQGNELRAVSSLSIESTLHSTVVKKVLKKPRVRRKLS